MKLIRVIKEIGWSGFLPRQIYTFLLQERFLFFLFSFCWTLWRNFHTEGLKVAEARSSGGLIQSLPFVSGII